MAKVTALKKSTEKAKEDEYNSTETYCAKVRTVLHMGKAEDKEDLEKLIQAYYAKTSKKIMSPESSDKTAKVEEKKEFISCELFNELHWRLEKAVAIADCLEIAIESDGGEMLDKSPGFVCVAIREMMEEARDMLRDAETRNGS